MPSTQGKLQQNEILKYEQRVRGMGFKGSSEVIAHHWIERFAETWRKWYEILKRPPRMEEYMKGPPQNEV